MKIAVINPNTTASMTDKIAQAARDVSYSETEIMAATSSMGPASIEGYYDEALAVPGLLLEISKAEKAGADAAIIACFDDTGLDAARSLARIPVLGICEAALATAAYIAQRYTVITTAEQSRLPVEGLVRRYGHGQKCNVRAANISVLSLEDPKSNARDLLRNEITSALNEDKTEAIVLGCAGMADLVMNLRSEFGLPVIDGVAAAVKHAEGLVALGLITSKRGPYVHPATKPYYGQLREFSPQVLS
ncbi:aspartate/glutamate racemase family protein [Cohaesibacter celericrescens]|uniref:Hydantoin racemase n=1 Tax=Cohaesibacter celericrescens TaxID=2067669 RepID=A0A2N5XPR3_9HYPH|nr:aspartate/glutamate racemase family protein [Cohaesibacter celericrescens]PLW76516.1 Asp/Glu/hydantoin racemase [Cohaesibacter celericrescens]